MSFFAVLFALLVEQLKPLPRDNWVHESMARWVRWTDRNFNAGEGHHVKVVWAVSVLAPTVLTAVVFLALQHYNLVLAFAFNVLVLYLTLGFRQFSHYYTDIRTALDRGDEAEARRLLGVWRHLDTSELPRTEVLRHVIEHALLAAHRHVFGVFFWFVVLSALGLGPMGAVLYRMSEFCSRYWAYRNKTIDAPFSSELTEVAQRAFALVDHLPARLTAFGFAVVGNFEEAVASWRRDAGLWLRPNEGIVLAAAAGAVGVQLGGPAAPGVTPDRSKTFSDGTGGATAHAQGSTGGMPVQNAHLHSVVGLVWRSVVLWMMLVALLGLANVLG